MAWIKSNQDTVSKLDHKPWRTLAAPVTSNLHRHGGEVEGADLQQTHVQTFVVLLLLFYWFSQCYLVCINVKCT